MGNTLPITSVPKPTESRAIIYIYSMGMLGKLQVEKDGNETVPSSLDGSVPDCVFKVAMDSISERCRAFRVLTGTGHMRHREESKLVSDLLAILHPWRSEYGIVAKLRKSRGKFIIGDNSQEKSVSCYCILLEKITPGYDLGTLSLSSFTDIESDDETPDV
eukprot:scaffold161696_cov70-Cyclotella_meneghiniana.AAC.2